VNPSTQFKRLPLIQLQDGDLLVLDASSDRFLIALKSRDQDDWILLPSWSLGSGLAHATHVADQAEEDSFGAMMFRVRRRVLKRGYVCNDVGIAATIYSL
jgi:hypothetical protein